MTCESDWYSFSALGFGQLLLIGASSWISSTFFSYRSITIFIFILNRQILSRYYVTEKKSSGVEILSCARIIATA